MQPTKQPAPGRRTPPHEARRERVGRVPHQGRRVLVRLPKLRRQVRADVEPTRDAGLRQREPRSVQRDSSPSSRFDVPLVLTSHLTASLLKPLQVRNQLGTCAPAAQLVAFCSCFSNEPPCRRRRHADYGPQRRGRCGPQSSRHVGSRTARHPARSSDGREHQVGAQGHVLPRHVLACQRFERLPRRRRDGPKPLRLAAPKGSRARGGLRLPWATALVVPRIHAADMHAPSHGRSRQPSPHEPAERSGAFGNHAARLLHGLSRLLSDPGVPSPSALSADVPSHRPSRFTSGLRANPL